MAHRIFAVMLAAGLAGCSHPHSQPSADSRATLLKPVATDGSENLKDTVSTNHKVHGAVSVGTGFGGRGSYGAGPQSGLGSVTGTGAGGMGVTPEGW
ncbi:hypothetical protein JK202_08930 [Gluconobacter sp. Dm-62]|uniref:hypothetical protein n=1 Tax=Gluconobacter sp. Dm-62 TaxID=2799804 RepID=UPI001B8C721C|nr:hypothetical protein [Gluconobacter sp. Dm-62]MBS1103141.1 hypothetical protein [Gluconobacter sp. Dm-62]